MSVSLAALEAFLAGAPETVLVEITGVAGSTPREKGAWMLVGPVSTLGTIGGGQLEYIGMDTARQILRNRQGERHLDVPLGPEIGQCCGGRVELSLRYLDADRAEILRRRLVGEISAYPHVYVMGAGHVGRALAKALALLPIKTVIVDSRSETLVGLPNNVEKRLSAIPEAEVRSAPQGSCFVVLTHDHALDFLIAREALSRTDSPYVGMIGSRSKRASFTSWLRTETGSETLVDRLRCPIGDHKLADKRPEVIAALVAAEILVQSASPRMGETMDQVQKRELVGES